ncbi:MATE family efflux transporter [Kineothrix sp. MSJ-39]|uniref:MATE family efflux transporter n=1 Tax=Kineothrix sp. MSJ-39 TaxID=2841533 RepID=UPI001C120B43|nr:MATE family efflux transporter [Kineothrix sp. MSJ-39]MBU5430620.1 MATE family efflux transporter [Kineothrix sp. MSJ-39]
MSISENKEIDMLHGPLLYKLIQFAIPIALSSMLQQLFNAADTAVVGHFASAGALAAVGTNGELVALLVSLSAGLSVGVNVLIARQIGLGRSDGIRHAVHTAILLSVLIGMIGLLPGIVSARSVLLLIHTPADILKDATLYLQLYYLGYPFLLIYDFAAAILRARGDSRRPFWILALSGLLNVILNLIFVIFFHMGVAGVAIATDLANLFAACSLLFLLTKEPDEFHLQFSALRLQLADIRAILAVGIPAALQGAVFCFANIFLQASINRFGAVVTAGNAIAMNFEYFGYYVITAFGQTATTFTSQNHAAGLPDRAKKVLLYCLLCSILFSGLITIPLTLFRGQASSLFSGDPDVIASACVRILCILSVEPMCSLYETPAGFLRGLGHSSLPAALTILGTCLLRILWVLFVFPHTKTLESLFFVWPLSWIVTSVLMLAATFLIHLQVRRSA